MKEIEGRNDIEFLVDTFYRKVLSDEVIGVFFTEIVQLDFDKHMPVMYDFWESTLLGHMKYRGNPMIKHIQLNALKTIEDKHFDRWLSLWAQTVRSHFKGEKAEEAIVKSRQIASLMKIKIGQHLSARGSFGE